MKTILRGEASRLDGPIGEGQYGYDPNLQPKYAYNPEKAKELVKQAGFPNGVDVELSTPVGRYTLDKQLTEAMVPMLTAVGIRTKLLRRNGRLCGRTSRSARFRSTTWDAAESWTRAQRCHSILKRWIATHRLPQSQSRRAPGGGAAGFQSREAQKIAEPGHESDHRGSACAFSLAPSTALWHGQEYRLPAAAQRAHLRLEHESEQVEPACVAFGPESLYNLSH